MEENTALGLSFCMQGNFMGVVFIHVFFSVKLIILLYISYYFALKAWFSKKCNFAPLLLKK